MRSATLLLAGLRVPSAVAAQADALPPDSRLRVNAVTGRLLAIERDTLLLRGKRGDVYRFDLAAEPLIERSVRPAGGGA